MNFIKQFLFCFNCQLKAIIDSKAKNLQSMQLIFPSQKFILSDLILTLPYWHSRQAPINPFSTNVSLLYPLPTLGNLWFSDIFWGYRSGILVENGLITYTKNTASPKKQRKLLFKSFHSFLYPLKTSENLIKQHSQLNLNRYFLIRKTFKIVAVIAKLVKQEER